MEDNEEYYAFISYKSDDVEWAIWLQHELEHYHLPASFNGRTDIRQELRPVFRDIDELSAGNLPEQIKRALENSQNLIVVCSPQAAASPWVNQEVETFISLGRTDRIFPFIVEGDSPKDFFPPALLALPKNEERLGGDAAKQGRDIAFVKVVAGMLGLGFDSLWNRYEKEKAEEERKQREQRDNLLRVQSRFIAEKAMSITDRGNSFLARKLLIEVLPLDLECPNRPYTIEAEASLRHACLLDSTILCNGTSRIVSAAFSPDGRRIVSSYWDNSIRIWEVKTGRCELVLTGHSGRIDSAGFSTDGKYIVSSASWKSYYPSLTSKERPDEIRIWKVDDGSLIHNLSWTSSSIGTVALSPDNQFVAMALGNEIYLWSTITWELLTILKGHHDAILQTVFSPDGRRLVSSSFDNTLCIWDVHSCKLIHILEKHTQFVSTINFSSDGTKLVSASRDHTIGLWDVEKGTLIEILKGHTGEVYDASFDCKGRFIASASADKTVRIWDVQSGDMVHCLNHDNCVYSVQFSPDQKSILSVSNSKSVHLWDVESGLLVKSFECMVTENSANGVPVKRASFSPDGKYILAVNNSQTIHLWETNTEQTILSIRSHNQPVNCASYSPDDRCVVSSSADKTVRMWETATGKLICTMAGHHDSVECVKYSPDGKYIVSASVDGTLCLWSTTDGTLLKYWKGHSQRVRSVDFCPSGDMIISSGDDKKICVWDARTGILQHAISNNSVVYSASFSPDGKSIVAACFDRNIRIWNVLNWELLHELKGHEDWVNDAQFSRNGKLIVSASEDGVVRVWDVAKEETILTLVGHESTVWTAAFSQDGDRVVSASLDGTIRVWDANNGYVIQKFQAINATSAVFSHNGKYVLGSYGDSIGIWDSPTLQNLIADTRKRFLRNPLTPEECRQYYLE